MPPPLRKLSQGKVDKSGAPDRPPLKKTPSDKRIRLPSGDSSSKQVPEEEESPARLENGEEAEDEAVELPPPMKPIQEPILVPSEDGQGERVSAQPGLSPRSGPTSGAPALPD